MLNFESPLVPEPHSHNTATLGTGNLLGHDGTQGLVHCLVQSLDHVGRGMLLVGPGGRLLYANRQAQNALVDNRQALLAEQGLVRARDARDQKLLAEALQAALQKGVRRLLTLGRHAAATGAASGAGCGTGGGADRGARGAGARTSQAHRALTVALLPIESPLQAWPGLGMGPAPGSHPGPGALRAQAVLISLQQCSHSKNLAVPIFAREHGCTAAETEVLEALLAGQTPEAIAQDREVQLCTVRTQIAQLRLKTGSHTIRELLDRVAALPPMMVVVQ